MDVRAPTPPTHVDIVIPAFNEVDFIGDTLASIQRSIQYLHSQPLEPPAPEISIRVAADGCTDKTAQVARQFAGVSVSESAVNQSKWVTIKKLLAESSADWILLVDSGTVWPETLLADILQGIGREKNIIAIAPAYRPLKAGWLGQLLWSLETTLKKMETICGGPVSLHGATVAYKTSLVKDALVRLGDTQWLNDDVVIPLTLRGLCPEGVILYPVGEVQDAGARHDQLDLGRRRRMVIGNLQWARSLLVDCFRRNPVAGVVACRRLFRVFWAWWVACFVLALALTFQAALWPGITLLGVLMISSGHVRQLGGAAFVSLLAPLLLIRLNRPLQETWK